MVKGWKLFLYDQEQNKGAYSHHPIQHSTGSPSQKSQARKRNKRHQNQKERGKISLLADNMILYIENLKALINNFSEAAGYKLNIQKPVVFLHTSNELAEKK